jgi:sigma-B regulation protein RsbU (phosphoserine phosphatase)
MLEKEEAEIHRIRVELDEAQNIQMALLPTESPDTKEFDIAGMSVPATQVGGDFYDYLTVANGHTAIAVADAAGKGLRGAMNAVLTNGMLHEVARFRSDADAILTDLNVGLVPRMYGPNFIALNLAILNASDKRIDYANGGQPYPILKRGTEIIEIENSDLPLGSMKSVQYESVAFDLVEGDVLIFHSDGLIEALNSDEEMYGTECLIELAAQIPNECTAEEVIQHIVEDVNKFVEEAEQYDDLTLVVIKRISASE